MAHTLSKRARDALGHEYRYARRERHPDEAPPRTLTPQPWAPAHPDLVVHIARPGAQDHERIKARGIG